MATEKVSDHKEGPEQDRNSYSDYKTPGDHPAPNPEPSPVPSSGGEGYDKG